MAKEPSEAYDYNADGSVAKKRVCLGGESLTDTDSWTSVHFLASLPYSKGRWYYPYRAVDSGGQALDFSLTARRDAKGAKRFLKKALKASHNRTPRVMNVDKSPAYPKAMEELEAEGVLPESCGLRQVKYLNNLIEQNHRSIKRLTKPGLEFQRLRTAWRTIRGYEAMNVIRKGQIQEVEKGAIGSQIKFIERLFGLAA